MDEGAELSLSSLVTLLEARFPRELSFLSVGGMTIYSSLTPPAAQNRYLGMGVTAVAREALGGKMLAGQARYAKY